MQQDRKEYDEEENDIAGNYISIKEELPDNSYVTINDINMIREMNKAQLNIDPETGEERDTKIIMTNNRYNLQPRPKKETPKCDDTNNSLFQNHIGMTLDYTSKGKVTISMFKHINKMLMELPSNMNGVAKVPAAGHLFNILQTQ